MGDSQARGCAPLPVGGRLQADGSLRRHDEGRLLVGGAPLRVVRLSTAGARRLDAWLAGEPPGDALADRALARRLFEFAMMHPLRPRAVSSLVAGDDVLGSGGGSSGDVAGAAPVSGSLVAGDDVLGSGGGSSGDVAGAAPVSGSLVAGDDVLGSGGGSSGDVAGAAPVSGSVAALGDVTVVIPVRDDPEGLSRLLGALGGAVPTLVVDDASGDPDSTDLVARRFGVRLVKRHLNGGPGAARNTGLTQVKTPIVVFVDADVVIDPPAINALLTHFSDPGVVAAAPRIRSRPGLGLLSSYEALYSPLDMGRAPSLVGPERPVRYVPAAVLAVRTSAIRQLGGFDETLRCGEDVDFVWRLVAAAGGDMVRYEPQVVAWHRPRASWRAWVDQRRSYGASSALLAERHGATVAPVRCTCAAAFAWSVLAWVRPVTAAVTIAAVTTAVSALRLAARLRPVVGMRLSQRLSLVAPLVLRSYWLVGQGLSRATTRAWLPLMLCGAGLSRRLRAAVVAAALVPPIAAWCRGRRPAGPLVSVGLCLADDIAYCAGVWQGMAAHRRLDAIRPCLLASTRTGRSFAA